MISDRDSLLPFMQDLLGLVIQSRKRTGSRIKEGLKRTEIKKPNRLAKGGLGLCSRHTHTLQVSSSSREIKKVQAETAPHGGKSSTNGKGRSF
jgi:hypothetical protein